MSKNLAPKLANEFTPRQLKFLDNFLNEKSDTFSNAYKSGLKAGYSIEYSRVIKSRIKAPKTSLIKYDITKVSIDTLIAKLTTITNVINTNTTTKDIIALKGTLTEVIKAIKLLGDTKALFTPEPTKQDQRVIIEFGQQLGQQPSKPLPLAKDSTDTSSTP